jgi:hypothetical protein
MDRQMKTIARWSNILEVEIIVEFCLVSGPILTNDKRAMEEYFSALVWLESMLP